jgi:SAM-dependent methyltransferase
VPEAGAYERIAGEYYDDFHRTSRNFDSATAAGLRELAIEIPDGLVLEAGSGRGRCQEYLRLPPARVVQLDNSPAMLSLDGREPALLRVLHDAVELPFPDDEFGCVLAFLCDAFLGLNFLAEAQRVLQPGGLLLGTTPSFEWGVSLREHLKIDRMTTRFRLRAGGELVMPSSLFDAAQLASMLEVTGFARDSISVRSHRLPVDVAEVSPDIAEAAEKRGVSSFELDIIYSFAATA